MSVLVAGIDISLTGTGVARTDGELVTVASKGAADATLAQRSARLAYIAAMVNSHIGSPCDLVVVEGPSFGQARQGGQHDRAGLWWLTVHHLHWLRIPVVEVPPATLKKFATGKGNATKPDMRLALYRRTGLDVADNDQCDAWWLRALGCHLLGAPLLHLPAGHLAALGAVALPRTIEETA